MYALSVFLLIILSIILISKGSDWLTDSLVPLARKLKTSNVTMGLLLVSTVISLPEILVAVLSSIQGYKEISLGVVFGSIICNIGLMTGISAMIRPLKATTNMILRDGIFSIVIPILIFAIGHEGTINRVDGLAIFLLFIPYLTNVVLQERSSRESTKKVIVRDVEVELDLIGFGFGKVSAGWLSFLFGSGFLLLGSYLLSSQMGTLVSLFHMDPIFLGLTLGALAPSIPNIAAAYKATMKGLTEVAIGETLGSNIFTLLVTVGLLSMISPITLPPQTLFFDMPAMMLMSFILFLFMTTGKSISKREGLILWGSYVVVLTIQTLFLR